MNTKKKNTGSACLSGHCPVETTLAVIGGKWKAVIIYHLRGGPKRFGELKKLIPAVTQRMLTTHLRELEEHGCLHREIFKVIPPKVEYSLTPLGHSLTPIMNSMARWGEKFDKNAFSLPANHAQRG